MKSNPVTRRDMTGHTLVGDGGWTAGYHRDFCTPLHKS